MLSRTSIACICSQQYFLRYQCHEKPDNSTTITCSVIFNNDLIGPVYINRVNMSQYIDRVYISMGWKEIYQCKLQPDT